jgi:hypothetical protein
MRRQLRLINTGWALITLVVIAFNIYSAYHYIGSGHKPFPDWELNKKLLFIFLYAFLFVRIVPGMLNPERTNYGTLKIIGGVARITWVFALIVVISFLYFGKLAAAKTEVAAFVVIMLLLTAFGWYTIKIIRSLPERPRRR